MSRNPKNILIIGRADDRRFSEELLQDLAEDGHFIQVLAHPPDESERDNAEEEDSGEKIEWADVVLVLIEEDSSSDEELEEEIELAHKKGKRLVGVWSGGSVSDLPKSLRAYGDAVVRPREDELQDAVDAVNELWCDPDGGDLPEPKIPRLKCP